MEDNLSFNLSDLENKSLNDLNDLAKELGVGNNTPTTRKDEIIYGTGFEANQDFTRYKIFNIKGTISINKEKND